MGNRPRDETEQRLLNDADFLRLMEAEYQNSQPAVNEIEKQRTWSAVKKRISSRKNRLHRGWLLVAAVILGFIPFVTMQNQDELGIKGPGPEPDVVLEIQRLVADGRLEIIEQPLKGQTLVFKVSSPVPSYLALALQIDADQPEIQFQSESPLTGQDQIFAADGQAFVYQLDQPGQTLKFCLLAASNRDELQQKMKDLAQHWPRIGAKLCQTLVVQ